MEYTCKGSNRVNRGGSWNNTAENCAVTYRNNNTPTNVNNNIGFRLALQLNGCGRWLQGLNKVYLPSALSGGWRKLWYESPFLVGLKTKGAGRCGN